jgi:hypothetical protein
MVTRVKARAVQTHRGRVSRARPEPEQAERGDGLEKSFQSERAHFLALAEVLEGFRDARRDEDLPAFGLAAEPRG